MTAPGQAVEDHNQQDQEHSPDAEPQKQPGPGQQLPAQAMAPPASKQQRAHRVLSELLEAADAHNLPPIDWKLTPFTAHLTGRCTASRGPARRRADFNAWTTMLGAHTSEDTTRGQT